MMFRHLLLLLIALAPLSAYSVTLEERLFKGVNYALFKIDLKKERLTHHWQDGEGRAYNSLQNFVNGVEREGRSVLFAINSGIYSGEYRPLGLHIEDGEWLIPLNRVTTNAGAGNFSLFPNGVFYITKRGSASVVTTEQFARLSEKEQREIESATQSGPMLLIDGAFNHRFIKGSSSLKLRSGVCVKDATEVFFVVGEGESSFYDFASLFRDELKCRDALYLDGTIARAYHNGRFYGATGLSRMRRLVAFWSVIG